MRPDYRERRQDADVGESVRARVLHVLRTRGPLTAQGILEVFSANGWQATEQGVRTRCGNLVREGALIEYGEFRTRTNGRAQIVWGVKA